MARTGRPPKPIEDHKRTGTYNATKHGPRNGLAAVAPIEPAAVTPLEREALDVLDEVLSVGVHWLARTDAPALVMLRDMLVERGPLRAGAMAGSTEDRKALRDLDKQVISLMAELGFNPAARARLGLAEVKAKSKLEELRERQARTT
jgi:hypothetical protein